jgi:hypothetical protein
VVDAFVKRKIPALLRGLGAEGFLETGSGGSSTGNGEVALAPGSIALVVGTHPHLDHIGGLAEVLNEFRGVVAEFWDPGYFHTIHAYHDLMREVELQPHLLYAQPTSGFRRWLGDVLVTTLSPGIHLRNRYDTYGVEINDSSISLRFDWPASRVVQAHGERRVVQPRTSSIILGADAQTLSWSHVLVDFPYLAESTSTAARAIKAAMGGDPLRADVLKVSHHGSKHGVNLELVKRIDPSVTLISSVRTGGSHGFPHTVAQELIREALDPVADSGGAHKDDWAIGIFYTGDIEEDPISPRTLGSIALAMGRGQTRLYRFNDEAGDNIDLRAAREWTG